MEPFLFMETTGPSFLQLKQNMENMASSVIMCHGFEHAVPRSVLWLTPDSCKADQELRDRKEK